MKTKLAYLLALICTTLLFARFDTYPKNHAVDIQHYSFAITLSDQTDMIIVDELITVLIKSNVKQIRLDLINQSKNHDNKGMTVKAVSLNGKTLNYTHRDDVLLIDLPVVKVGEQITIAISYSGIPADALKIAPNKYGDRCFFSDNWPNKARHWLATVDHPYDKATSEMIITAPNHYQVVSNGLLIEETNLDKATKRTHWKQSVPIATWLYDLGVAEFAVQYVDQFEGKSIQTWVYKQDRDKGFYDFAVPSKHVLEFYSDYVGPYAYEKLANIQSNSVGGGMEAASAIFYGDNSVTGERSVRWRNVIIHEIAHQWFGNAVTEADWDDVWLSEGITTFFTLLFREHAYGYDDYVAGLEDAKKRVFEFDAKNPDYRIVHDNLADMSKVTTGQTYQKGAWVMHMLRSQIGNEAFQKGIRSYYSKYFNGNATTALLISEMEATSGQELEWFFKQWLHRGGHPKISGKVTISGKLMTIDHSQVQDGEAFVLPLEFALKIKDKTDIEYHTVMMTKKKQQFNIEASGDIIEVLDLPPKLLAEWVE